MRISLTECAAPGHRPISLDVDQIIALEERDAARGFGTKVVANSSRDEFLVLESIAEIATLIRRSRSGSSPRAGRGFLRMFGF